MAANRLDWLQTKYSENCKRKKTNAKMSNYRVNYIAEIYSLDIMVQTIRYERMSKFTRPTLC